MKIARLMQKFEDWVVSDSMNLCMTFLNITIVIIFFAHYIGCFFFYFGNQEYKNGLQQEVRDETKGWLVAENLIDAGFIKQYITSIYWAFTTMAAVGYGEIVPVEPNEVAYAMVIIIMSSFLFAYSVNSIGTIVSNYNALATQYRERMMYVNSYMLKSEMPN